MMSRACTGAGFLISGLNSVGWLCRNRGNDDKRRGDGRSNAETRICRRKKLVFGSFVGKTPDTDTRFADCVAKFEKCLDMSKIAVVICDECQTRLATSE